LDSLANVINTFVCITFF